jgi:hypothetical protein
LTKKQDEVSKIERRVDMEKRMEIQVDCRDVVGDRALKMPARLEK